MRGSPPPGRRPAELLAARVPVPGPRDARGYPPVVPVDDSALLQVQLAATRGLVHCEHPQEVRAVVVTFVRDLGGEVVPARLAEVATLPLDLSLGVGEPLLPVLPEDPVACRRLTAVLPEFLEDARAKADRLRALARRAVEAEQDALTGLLTRRAWMRRLGRAGDGDVVCLLDLDRFKEVNDAFGHAAGDRVLAAFADVLREVFRELDACGRYGGDELGLIAWRSAPLAVVERLEEVREQWELRRPHEAASVGFSAGVARVTAAGARAALEAADDALYRAKDEGRGRSLVAPGLEPGT